jgi:hypothetical protein
MEWVLPAQIGGLKPLLFGSSVFMGDGVALDTPSEPEVAEEGKATSFIDMQGCP